MNKFKKQHSLEKRKEESKRIMEKYDQRIPLIVLKDTKCTLPDIDRYKFLAPYDITLGQFMYVVRKRIKLETHESIYFFVNENVLVNSSQSMITIYDSHKDEDGFLYLTYCTENVFG